MRKKRPDLHHNIILEIKFKYSRFIKVHAQDIQYKGTYREE